MRLFAIPFPIQEAQISAWCWGSCGHGGIGAVDLGPCAAIVCRQAECHHLDREMSEPMGDVDGEPVYLRKLKDVEP